MIQESTCILQTGDMERMMIKTHIKSILFSGEDINEEQFWEVIDSWRSSHIWKKTNNEWELKNKVWKT